MNELGKAMEAGKRPRCLHPWQTLMIDVTGAVQPCAYRGNYTNTENTERFGNLNEQSLEEIWNGPVAQRVRRCMAAGDLVGAGCGKCLAVAQGQDLGLEYDMRAVDDPVTPYSQNLATKIDEIVTGAEILRSRPTVLYYTPDHRCNLSCLHCYQNLSRKDSIKNKDAEAELLGLVPVLSDVIAGGGEPLILPFWRRFLASPAKQVNRYMRFMTTTNATIVRDDVFSQISSFDRISIIISLDGATKKTFETIRQPANWEKFLANARKLRALCSEKHAFFSFNISTMKGNLVELPKFVQFCADFEAPFNYQPVVAFPASQSLRCFNDPVREMAGWKEALAGAREILQERFFPAMQRAREAGRAEWSDSYASIFEGHIDALHNLIPWHLLDQEYHDCVGQLPSTRSKWIEAVESSSKTFRKGGRGSIVLFYRDEDGPGAEPHFYSPLDDELGFRVRLPAGKWRVATTANDAVLPSRATAWPEFELVVTPSEIVPHTSIPIYTRLRSFAGSRARPIVTWLQQSSVRARRSVSSRLRRVADWRP